VYCVVADASEKYSVWPLEKPIPAGWASAGFQGSKV